MLCSRPQPRLLLPRQHPLLLAPLEVTDVVLMLLVKMSAALRPVFAYPTFTGTGLLVMHVHPMPRVLQGLPKALTARAMMGSAGTVLRAAKTRTSARSGHMIATRTQCVQTQRGRSRARASPTTTGTERLVLRVR
eukprot:Rmarinus@m.8723